MNKKRPRWWAVASATDMESPCPRDVHSELPFEGALLRSNAISRRRIMPEDDNALVGRDLLCYFQASKFWPGENEVGLPVSELNRKCRILFAKLHSPLPIPLKHEK